MHRGQVGRTMNLSCCDWASIGDERISYAAFFREQGVYRSMPWAPIFPTRNDVIGRRPHSLGPQDAQRGGQINAAAGRVD
eukprot:6181017-Pleurochrysis_carterae.AAC.2